MTDEYAIQHNISLYTEGASRGDWDQAVATFLPDGIWEIPAMSLKFEGHDAIRSAFINLTGAMDYIVQLNTPAIIKVSGDTATARCVIREVGKYKGRDEALEVLGFYADKLVRKPDGWKFAHRICEVRATHNFPLSPQAK
jgi:ketosteroid isomerase-like protein